MLIILVGWFITDNIVEPRLVGTKIDGDEEDMPQMEQVSAKESKAFWMGFGAMMVGIVGLIAWAIPADSALRGPDMINPEVMTLTSFNAPLMGSIVPLIFVLLLIPGVVYGFASGKYTKSKDMIDSMSKSMQSMGYYIVMAFFCALFIDAFLPQILDC